MKRLLADVCVPAPNEVQQLLDEEDCPSVFQTPELAQTYKRTKDCRVVLLGIPGADGRICASLLSVVFHSLPAAHASIRGGPLCSRKSDAMELAQALLKAHESAVGMQTLYTRIYPASPAEVSLRIAGRCGFVLSPWLNFLIPLSDLNAQWEKLSKARRKGIQHAQKSAIRLRDVSSAVDVGTVVRLLRLSARHGRYALQHASLFAAIREHLVRPGLARMVLAEMDGNAVATRVVLTYRGVVYDWYAGSDPKWREAHADEWLVWELLRWGHDRGFTLFDFGGAGVPGVPYGPREFKRRFGGEETNIGRLTHEHYPRTLRVADSLYRLYQGGAKE